MDVYGLVGEKLSHSFSPDFFNNKFRKLGIKSEYKLFELQSSDNLPELIADNPDIKGLNVTIPYKRAVARFMDYIDKPAMLTGSINTIKIKYKKNKPILYGYNTDVVGFENSIKPLLKNKTCVDAIILGSGGSAKSVAYVLRKYGILFNYVTRNKTEITHRKYNWLCKETIEENLLIFNATPVGMYPNIDESLPIPYEHITKHHILFDLIYNPKETLFLKNGSKQGAICVNGLEMLKIQAEASWKIWKK